MAPPGKASVQKRGRMTRTPSETSRNARQSRRSTNPPNQPTPARTRDEPPARSTRSWVSAPRISNIRPTASQRVPIDCPVLGCRAKTLHQHLPQLQYFHPRPGRPAHYHGYGSSNRDTSSRPSLVVTLRVGSRDQSTTQLEPEVAAEDEPAEQEQRSEEQDSADDESPTSHLPAAASNLDGDQESDRDLDRMRNSLPEHRDPTHREGTSSLFQAPITPPPSSPLAAEETPSAQASAGPLREDPEPAVSPAPPMEFGDWLPGRGPENSAASQPTPMPHIHTYDELIRPLVDPTLPPAPGMAKITEILQECQSERDLDMPSLTMRSPLSEYMWQFREEAEVDYDYEDFMWQ